MLLYTKKLTWVFKTKVSEKKVMANWQQPTCKEQKIDDWKNMKILKD